jgi:hypothetical protein
MGMPDMMKTHFGSEADVKPAGAKPKRKGVKGGALPPSLGIFGMGLPVESKAADVSGGGLLSSALGMIGLGLPMGVKDDGKMSDAKMKKVVSHVRKHKGPTYVKHLKGAGFFDDAFRGISQGFHMVPGASLLTSLL